MIVNEYEHEWMDRFNSGHNLPEYPGAYRVCTVSNLHYPSVGDVQWLGAKAATDLAWKLYNAGHDVVVEDDTQLRYIDIRQDYSGETMEG